MNRSAKRLLKKQADKRMKPWQKQVKPGALFFRTLNVSFNDDHLTIKMWCEILEVLDQHTIKVKCFSSSSPEGEEGEMHKCTVEKLITKSDFEHAEQRGWQ